MHGNKANYGRVAKGERRYARIAKGTGSRCTWYIDLCGVSVGVLRSKMAL